MSSSFNNNIDPINLYFNTTEQTNVASLSSSGTLYTNVQTQIACTAATPTVTCPNQADDSGLTCQAPLINNFCNSNGAIGYINISNEFTNTVQNYASTLANLVTTIAAM